MMKAVHDRRARCVRSRGRSGDEMTFVITEPCIGTKDTACVDVCPVDCIHPTKDDPEYESSEMLYIDPEECIDCGACEPACPVEAIFEEDAVPDKWQAYTAKNAEYFKK
jgi:ferredoxin